MGKSKIASFMLRLIEIVLGAVFITSGLGKMTNSADFGELISSYGLAWFSILSPVIILMELAVGLCLILRLAVKKSLVVTIIMLIAFTLAFLNANLFHDIEDCGCFGELIFQPPVWAVYLRNILLLSLAVWLLISTKKARSNLPLRWRLAMFVALMALSIFWTGKTWHLPTVYKDMFGSEQRLLGVALSETPLEEYVKVSPDSTYLVWVYSNRCSRCINSIENIKRYQTGVADCFIALDVKNDSNNIRHQLLNITFPSRFIGKKPEGIIRSLPTLLYVEKGKIKHVIEGEVPSVYYFKTRYLGMTDEEITSMITGGQPPCEH